MTTKWFYRILDDESERETHYPLLFPYSVDVVRGICMMVVTLVIHFVRQDCMSLKFKAFFGLSANSLKFYFYSQLQ